MRGQTAFIEHVRSRMLRMQTTVRLCVHIVSIETRASARAFLCDLPHALSFA